jgi:hypothetical protein
MFTSEFLSMETRWWSNYWWRWRLVLRWPDITRDPSPSGFRVFYLICNTCWRIYNSLKTRLWAESLMLASVSGGWGISSSKWREGSSSRPPRSAPTRSSTSKRLHKVVGPKSRIYRPSADKIAVQEARLPKACLFYWDHIFRIEHDYNPCGSKLWRNGSTLRIASLNGSSNQHESSYNVPEFSQDLPG